MSNARNLARLLPNASGQLPITQLDSSVTSHLGLKNILINGDFRIWQKGTSGSWSGNGIQSADRWVHQYVDFTPTQTKQEDTINGETVDCLQLIKTGGSYTGGETTQKVETATAKYLRGQTVTWTFWIKKIGSSFGSHNFDCWIGDSETVDDTGWTNPRTMDRGRASRQVGISTAVTFVDNNWQKIKITRTLSSDTNTIYCSLYTGNTPTGEGIRIAKAQLELGSYGTDFERRPLAMEYEMCRRFQQKNYPMDTVPGSNAGWPGIVGRTGMTGITTNGGELYSAYVFPVEMRASPSVTTWDLPGNINKCTGTAYQVSDYHNLPFTITFSGQSGLGGNVTGQGVLGGISFRYLANAEF